MASERSALHILPHPGGGGEAYVDLLEAMPGYRFDRVYLAEGSAASPLHAIRGAVRTNLLGRRFDLVHVHGEVAAGLCLPVLAARPTVVTLHGLHLVRRLQGLRWRAATLNLRAVLRAADRTICVSQREHDELVRIVGPVAAKRAVVVRNGVRIPPPRSEADRAAVRRELGISAVEVVGIWVGSLDERKDPLTAVRAAREARVTLLVVGDGPLWPEVERAASARVKVLGQRQDVPRLLAAADFYVSTSRREGLSLSLLEAMASGLAPVVTDLPENVEAIGDTGIAFRDESSFSAALRQLVRDTDERAAMGERAWRRVSELFSIDEMVNQTRAVYSVVLRSPSL